MIFWKKKNKKEAIKGAGIAKGLEKTRKGFFGRIGDLIRGSNKIDEDFLEELEEILISSDVGVKTSMEIVEELREQALKEKSFSIEEIQDLIKDQISRIFEEAEENVEIEIKRPQVILVMGVNGTGKTTTIGKLAHRLTRDGQKVILAAADTFRAAAIEQLTVWAERSGAEIIKHKAQSDPAAVVFDALQAAKNRDADTIIIDTAGRLHTKSNLMSELEKISRICGREIPDAPHEVFLVLDATTGQNGLQQAREFLKYSGITGIVLTKLDGTAKGGVVVAITKEINLPIRFVGVGEGIDDLIDFDPDEFVDSLFSTD
jgi:fused signal recognition particle receptor